MASIQIETTYDWEDLSFRLDDYFKHFNSYIFRGQADANWKLESTLSRALKRVYPKTKNKSLLVENLLTEFMKNIRGRNNIDFANVSEDELWALGQHYGLFTPLLDWTHSPYVATFFSLFGECTSGNRAIWAILKEDIEEINKEIKKPNKKVEVINPITNHNQRLVSQRGLFLKIPLESDLESWVKKGKNFKWVTMYKIIFPDKLRHDALAALDNMNINYASLFPDLIGSSLHTNYQFEIEPYLDEERGKSWKKMTEEEKLAKKRLKEIKNK